MKKDKINKLINDLKESKRLALEEIKEIKDTGSCNTDSIILYLPRIKEDNFNDLMNEVGLYGFKSKHWGNVCYKISPAGNGSANKRLKSMETMVDYLKSCGWYCSYFYQID